MKNKAIFKSIFIVLMVIITAATLSLEGIYLGNIITAISKLNIEQFKENLIIMAILVLVNFISSNLAFALNFNLGMEKFIRLKNEIFKRDIKNRKKINIANYTTNIENLYANRFMIKINVINLFFTMFFSVISIIYINYKLLPVAIIAASFPMLVPFLLGKKVQEKSASFNNYYNFYQKYIAKKIKERDEFLRYKVEDKLMEEKDKIERKHERNRKDLKYISTISNISSQSMGSLSFILVFLSGGYFAFKGEIEVGAVISLVQLMNYLVDPVIALSSLYSLYNESKPLYKQIKDIVKEPVEEREKIYLHRPINLRANNLSFAYNDEKKIIDKFTYDFLYGKKYLIRGESGRGKSTLGKVLAGELNPTEGEVLLNNKDIKNFDYRDYVLYVDQKPVIIDDKLENNVKFYRNIDDIDLSSLNIDRKKQDGIGEENRLSGGEMMRISILRSLLEPKSIIIYDEPVASLDEVNAKKIFDKLLALDATVIIISHRVDAKSLKKFDEVIQI